MVERIVRETSYHDLRFADPSVRSGAQRFYRIASTVHARYRELLFECAERRSRALEYSYGTVSYAFVLADIGARVISIVISRVAIRQAISKTKVPLSATPDFMVMNAEELGFCDGSFELVCGTGILYHLELDSALDGSYRLMILMSL